MAKGNGYHLRIPHELEARIEAVRTGIEIAGDARRLTPHPKKSQLFIALAEDLCVRFEAGESVVTLPGLAKLCATQVIMKDGKATTGLHLSPIGTVELYAALAEAPRIPTFDEEMLLKLDARRLVVGSKAYCRGKVFTDPTNETPDLPTLWTLTIRSIRDGVAQATFESAKKMHTINVFDLIPEHEAERQRAALEGGSVYDAFLRAL